MNVTTILTKHPTNHIKTINLIHFIKQVITVLSNAFGRSNVLICLKSVGLKKSDIHVF